MQQHRHLPTGPICASLSSYQILVVAGPIHSISSSVEPSWPICLWWFALITSHRRRQGNHKVSLLVSHNFYKTEHPQTYYFYLFSSWYRVPWLASQILLSKRNIIILMEFSMMLNTSVNVYSFMSVISLCADIISIYSSVTNCQQLVISLDHGLIYQTISQTKVMHVNYAVLNIPQCLWKSSATSDISWAQMSDEGFHKFE